LHAESLVRSLEHSPSSNILQLTFNILQLTFNIFISYKKLTIW